MDTVTTDLLIQAAYAVGIGLVIGLEREHHYIAEDLAPNETPEGQGMVGKNSDAGLGVRTFALLSLLGWLIGHAGLFWTWLPAVGLMVAAALVAVQYALSRNTQGAGLTTETAALVTFMLGMLVHHDHALAVALALATTLLLISKPWMHSLVARLRRVELTATLQLLILLAIVLPLLPTEPMDPWEALPPRKIGLFVILIAGLSYVGYVASRILGGRRGVGLTGILGGIASSTAVTVAMSKVGQREDMRHPAQLAVLLANSVMFVRVIVITAVLSPTVALRLALPMDVMAGVMLLGGLWKWRVMAREDGEDLDITQVGELRNPFAILPALKWGVVLSAVLLMATLAQDVLGNRGLVVASALSGIADVDAITLAVTRQASEQAISLDIATLAITVAVISNTVIKAGMALVGGGRRFGLHIVLIAIATMAAGAVAAIFG